MMVLLRDFERVMAHSHRVVDPAYHYRGVRVKTTRYLTPDGELALESITLETEK